MKPIVLRYYMNSQSKNKSQNSFTSRSLASTIDSFHQLRSSRSEIDISNEEKSQYYFPLNKSDFSSSFNSNADSIDKSTTLRHLSNWDREIIFKRKKFEKNKIFLLKKEKKENSILRKHAKKY